MNFYKCIESGNQHNQDTEQFHHLKSFLVLPLLYFFVVNNFIFRTVMYKCSVYKFI